MVEVLLYTFDLKFTLLGLTYRTFIYGRQNPSLLLESPRRIIKRNLFKNILIKSIHLRFEVHQLKLYKRTNDPPPKLRRIVVSKSYQSRIPRPYSKDCIGLCFISSLYNYQVKEVKDKNKMVQHFSELK